MVVICWSRFGDLQCPYRSRREALACGRKNGALELTQVMVSVWPAVEVDGEPMRMKIESC
ncbi:hypothetical protein BKP30_27255 [Rhodococcus erythropolis]|nr:hypothetical protein BKP30_27255 [Rhodococcus erythropolis]